MSDTTNYSDFEKDLENEAYWKAVFGPDNEPQRDLKPGTRHTTLLGWFPTKKCVRGEVRTREPLMGDLLFHLDTDPAIRVIAEFPIRQLFDAHKADGTQVVKEHIPDLAVLRMDGAVFVIDVMPYHVRKSIRGMAQRRADLRQHYSKLGATYLLLDETTIRLEPLFSNLRLMWKHKQSNHEPAGMAQLRDALREASYPASIEALMRCMPQNAIFARWSDEPTSAARHVIECNPTFSAVMQLAIAGEVEVDLGSKLSSKTIVTRKEPAHA
ncbi:hypothetical protein [Neorhizobium sp. T6_25]|uniref:hypothetical protein n=1 Tax=Neorhizobium sp. T6_25 TaxID=2093833 RepID=UPI000CFA2629|nr:hypothetical protein [Neorhizobium sp. T6_25]